MTFATVNFDTADHVATITLNRPERLNAFNQRMLEEFSKIWIHIRQDDAIRSVVLRAAGDRAFSTGVDRKDGIDSSSNVWNRDDPGFLLSPKHHHVWKPVVCAVNGMAAGGAFYWINESDIVICSEDATFFDPHVTYGMTAALEPIGLSRRIPLGEVLRIALMGLDERVGAQRAREIGLVTEVVPAAELWGRADEIARSLAAKPPAAIQGTVRAIWESLDLTRSAALGNGMKYTQIGNPVGAVELGSDPFGAGVRPEWRLR